MVDENVVGETKEVAPIVQEAAPVVMPVKKKAPAKKVVKKTPAPKEVKAETKKLEIKPEKRGEKKEKKSGKKFYQNPMLWIAIIIVAIIVVAALLMMSMSKPQPKPVVTNGTVVSGPKLALNEIAPGFEEAVSSAQHMKASGKINLNMASANEQQAISLAMDFTSEYDLVADKAKMEMTMNMGSGLLGGMEFVTKTYTTDNASYMGTSDLSGGFTWTKYPVNESQGVKKSVESMLAVIDSLEGTVIGTETINGKQTDKIKVDADVEKVVRTLISSQAESLGNIDEAQINEAVGTIKDAITKLDLTLWVAKDTSLPVKLKADADLAIDLGAMYGSTGSEQMLEMSMALTANFDFESAVSIVVPPEALEAVDYGTALNDLEYESVCGDGWCDWNENSTSCPADCYCGDGLCLGEENETNCAEDCAQAIQ